MAIVALTSLGAASAGQVSESGRDPAASVGELIFRSGFEEDVRLEPFGETSHRLFGRDLTLGSHHDWVEDLVRAGIGHCSVNYTGGDTSKRFARIIEEPGHPGNRVLWFWLDDSYPAWQGNVNGRVQIDLYDIAGGLREFSQSVRVFLHEDFRTLRSYPDRIGWLSIVEIWNNQWWIPGERYGFRITLGIGKPSGNERELTFILAADDLEQRGVWRGHEETPVPVGRWFTLEYFFREGDSRSGRFTMWITPEGGERQLVYDIAGFTHHTRDPSPDGVTGFNPLKLYTSKDVIAFMKSRGKTLQIYWDDFSLWRGPAPWAGATPSAGAARREP